MYFLGSARMIIMTTLRNSRGHTETTLSVVRTSICYCSRRHRSWRPLILRTGPLARRSETAHKCNHGSSPNRSIAYWTEMSLMPEMSSALSHVAHAVTSHDGNLCYMKKTERKKKIFYKAGINSYCNYFHIFFPYFTLFNKLIMSEPIYFLSKAEECISTSSTPIANIL